MRIAIMGSGGVGGYVGAWLQQAGQDVSFIARGAHLAALRAQGLRIEHPQWPLHLPQVQAGDDPAQVGPVDLVIFAVKLFDTESAARRMAPLVGPETRVLTLQNGIDSVAMIRAQLGPAARVHGGVIYVSAVIGQPGVIRSPGGLHHIVADSAQGDPVMATLQQAAAGLPGLEIKLSDQVDPVIWEKFVVLAAVSGATTLMRARLGPINGHPQARAFLRQLVDEAVALAQASGIGLREGLADEVMARIAGMPPTMRSSMSEDLERGNRLELGWLSGRAHALGLALGVPTSAHTAVYRGLVLYENGRPADPA